MRSIETKLKKKIIKTDTEEVIVSIINYMNKCISWSFFSDGFKIADVYPVYKNEDVNPLLRNVVKWSDTL